MTIPRCQHLKVNGTQCGSPALHGKRFCYFHSRHQIKSARDSAFDFPVLEDANAIQIALMQVIRAIADGKIECKRAGLLLYALQTASYNLKRTNLEPKMSDVVRDTSSLAQEITPPPDPVEVIRAMRRDYWKLRDRNLLNLDREIVARECAPKSPDCPITRSPDATDPCSSVRISGSESQLATDSDDRDALINFVSQITRSPDHPITG